MYLMTCIKFDLYYLLGKKGGALASAIHSYIQHADPSIRSLIKHKLTLVAEPIFTYIIRWMYGGQLEDIYHEVRN